MGFLMMGLRIKRLNIYGKSYQIYHVFNLVLGAGGGVGEIFVCKIVCLNFIPQIKQFLN